MEDWYATVSSTLLILTDTNRLHLFERIYDHSHLRPFQLEEDKMAEDLLLDF